MAAREAATLWSTCFPIDATVAPGYPTQSDNVPSNDLPDAGNNANFYQSCFTQSGTNKLTDVGTFASSGSCYETFDQGGNVWEWNDAVIGLSRGLRGGSWNDNNSQLHPTQ